MYRDEIVNLAATQLAYDYNCTSGAFFSNSNTVTTAVLSPNRRRFLKQTDFLKICSMGNGAVITCNEKISSFMKEIAKKYDGATIFEEKVKFLINKELAKYNKIIGEVSIYFLPKTPYNYIQKHGFSTEIIEADEIPQKLYHYTDFPNALLYDRAEPNGRKDVLACVATNAGKIIAMAGASNDAENFWQIGIDVLQGYRGSGIGTELVSKLTNEVFMRGAVPYYGTWAGNLPSFRTAGACGYKLAWTEMYATNIE